MDVSYNLYMCIYTTGVHTTVKLKTDRASLKLKHKRKMAYTEQQKAYHLRKIRTRAARLDITKDGFISREDYEIMSKRLSEYSNLNEEQTKKIHKFIQVISDSITGDAKIPVEEYAMKISQAILGETDYEKKRSFLETSHGNIFDVINTNGDGRISVEEFKVYLNVVAPIMTEDEAKHAFDVIDANKNGKINREEFMAAIEDFYCGVEETELAAAYMGKLVD